VLLNQTTKDQLRRSKGLLDVEMCPCCPFSINDPASTQPSWTRRCGKKSKRSCDVTDSQAGCGSARGPCSEDSYPWPLRGVPGPTSHLSL
jgi:hypothetical protein